MSIPKRLTGRQIRAGRVMAGYSVAELAKTIGVAPRSIIRWEGRHAGFVEARPAAVAMITRAFYERGICVFSEPAPGLREMTADEITLAMEASKLFRGVDPSIYRL